MVSVSTARRAFLKGHSQSEQLHVRMPWMAEDFADICDRCGDCIDACDERVIAPGDGGYPSVDFNSGGCTFCGDCVTACQAQALKDTGQPAWPLRASIDGACLDARGTTCRACGDACEPRAIRFQLHLGGTATVKLDQDLCNGCGSCIAVCPIQIIQIQEAT